MTNNTKLIRVLYDLDSPRARDLLDEDEYWQDVFYDTLFNYYSSCADIVINDIHSFLLDDNAHDTIAHLLLLVSIMESENAEATLNLLYAILKTTDLDDSTKAVKSILTLSKVAPDIIENFIDYVLMDDLIVECVLEEHKKYELRYCSHSKDYEIKEDAYGCM